LIKLHNNRTESFNANVMLHVLNLTELTLMWNLP